MIFSHIYYSYYCYQLESLNLRICKNHLDQGGTIGSWRDIQVSLFIQCFTAVYFYICCRSSYVHIQLPNIYLQVDHRVIQKYVSSLQHFYVNSAPLMISSPFSDLILSLFLLKVFCAIHVQTAKCFFFVPVFFLRMKFLALNLNLLFV